MFELSQLKPGLVHYPEKVQAVLAFPVPVNLKAIQLFLGSASYMYYSCFIPNFQLLAHCLPSLGKTHCLHGPRLAVMPRGLGVVCACQALLIIPIWPPLQVYTDHEAFKGLLNLNTPHPSGKLACWGMALQELDLEILY